MKMYKLAIGSFSLLFSSLIMAAAVQPPEGNPKSWACAATLEPATPTEIKTWCDSYISSEIARAPEYSGKPATLADLAAKNNYDEAFGTWLETKAYKSWAHDKNWRFAGPAVGQLSGGKLQAGTKYYGSHPAVRIYYSPKVVKWLCNGRKGDIEDGAIIVKQQISPESVDVSIDNDSCMTITNKDIDGYGYAVMVRDQQKTHDGWYWWTYGGPGGNPPILGRSAATDATLGPVDGDHPQTGPKTVWYPTSTSGSYTDPSTGTTHSISANNVYPYNLYGAYCVNCHASAEKQSTFSSIDNMISPGIQYKFYSSTPTASKHSLAASGSDHIVKHDVPVNSNKTTLTEYSPPTQRPGPFSTPRQNPSDAFTKFYDQIPPVDFNTAWKLRLPSETFDHAAALAGDNPGQFLTSDQCIGCHDATVSNAAEPNMVFTEADGTKINLSPYATWRVSPMGLAGRDPIFFSQLQGETNYFPQLTECIENTCLHCHGVMGQRQQARDTEATYKGDTCKDFFPVTPPAGVPFGKPFGLNQVSQYQDSEGVHSRYGALARDGISCTVCHHISPTNLGEEKAATGNFVSGPADELYGPYKNDTIIPKPMQHALGVTPKFGAQINDSALCSSCHDILLPVLSNSGKPLGASYEQTTGLEWENSVFARWGTKDFQSCQDCHMRTQYQGVPLKYEIANIQSSNDFAPTTHALPDKDLKLTTRKHFARHTLAGLNVFLNEMFQEFPVLLGLSQIDFMNASTKPALTHARDTFLEIARQTTANIEVGNLNVSGNTLSNTVTVTNQAGHYLPSGVGFRRMLLEYRVIATDGSTLWCSGCTNGLGVVLDGVNGQPLASELPIKNPTAYQQHYLKITSQNQAQIYQELIHDSDGNFTTSFIRRVKHIKDNRIRPRGYDPEWFASNPSQYIRELKTTYGNAAKDPYYTNPNLTGADQIEYNITLDAAAMSKVSHVEVTLSNQSIPPFYLQQRFNSANLGAKKSDEIKRLWYLTSHLNTDSINSDGKPFIKDWKLGIACSGRSLSGSIVPCDPAIIRTSSAASLEINPEINPEINDAHLLMVKNR